MREHYIVVAGPFYSRSHAAYARRFSAVEDAVSAMDEGMVVDQSGRLVAFHERHLATIERLG